MRISRLFAKPSKSKIKSEDSISGQFLVQAGFIHKLASGSYDYLPLGLKVLKKVEDIIRDEFNKVGAQEILSPVVHPASLWQESGRLKEFGSELVVFRNRKKQQLVLAPTHEETISLIARKYLNSYQDLPILVNQIQTKYRDEPRPRGGLLRAREFIMQDAYSFDIDRKNLNQTYLKIRKVYQNIFERCGLNPIIVNSDVGAMGGYEGEEFMMISERGEDRLILCPKGDYQANIEVAEFKREKSRAKKRKLEQIKTPKTKTIAQLCAYLKIRPEQTAKMVFYLVDNKLVAAVVRGDLNISHTKLINLLRGKKIEIAPKKMVRKAGAIPGFANPRGIRAKVVIDPSIINSQNLVIGANREGYHLKNFNFKRDFRDRYQEADIAEAKEGLPCPKCGAALKEEKGIELGHIFKLGQKYSRSLKVFFADRQGREQIPEMGCYGIGLGRLMAAVIEKHHDEQGMIWPKEISPFQYYLIGLGGKKVIDQAEKIYQELQKKKRTVLFDDRDESAGVKFNDADLIGIPNRLVVSRKTIKEGKIELSKRGEEKKKLVQAKDL